MQEDELLISDDEIREALHRSGCLVYGSQRHELPTGWWNWRYSAFFLALDAISWNPTPRSRHRTVERTS